MCVSVSGGRGIKRTTLIYFFYSKIKLTWLVAGVHPYVVNPEAPYSAIRGTAAGSLSLSADQDIIMELGREAVVSIYGRRRAANCSTG